MHLSTEGKVDMTTGVLTTAVLLIGLTMEDLYKDSETTMPFSLSGVTDVDEATSMATLTSSILLNTINDRMKQGEV